MLTLGGDAELELVDSLDPFSEGIVFSVRPPKKSWKNIANLSGGEKTLRCGQAERDRDAGQSHASKNSIIIARIAPFRHNKNEI